MASANSPWFQDKELREWIEDGKNELEGAL